MNKTELPVVNRVLVLFFVASALQSYGIPPVEVQAPAAVTQAQEEPSWVDRFGEPLERGHGLATPPRKALGDVACATGVRLHFEDVAFGTGIGFDDPGSGAVRRQTACALWDQYLALEVLNLGGATPDIVIETSELDGTGAIATGSAFYTSGGPPGFAGGTLYEYIATGIDPTPAAGSYDARIKVDFGLRKVGAGSVGIHADHTTSPGGQLDLFSILLHETMHALGFASLIQPNGQSLLGGPYSRFDRFLADAALAPLIHPTNFVFQAAPSTLTSGGIVYDGISNGFAQAVYSPVFFSAGSSLSHFDNARDGEQYVMRPSTSGGPDRRLREAEIGVLCDLGYQLLGTQCSNHFPIGIGDAASAQPGQQVCVPILGNDTDADGDPLAVAAGSIVIQNGGGSATMVGNQLCYTSSIAFVGSAIVIYRPTDGSRVGNATHVVIDIAGNFCPGDPCNLVCNGGFENGISLADFESFPIFDDFNACINGNSNVDRWCRTAGTPDLFIRGSQKPGPSAGVPNQGIPKSFFSQNAPGGEVETRSGPGTGNDRYVGMILSGANQSIEGVYTRLVRPLMPGETYQLGLFAHPVRRLGSSSAANLVVALDSVKPPSSFGGTNTVLSSQAATFSSAHPVYSWSPGSFVGTAGAPGLEYLIVEPDGSSVGTADDLYIFLDDVSLRQLVPSYQIHQTVDDPLPQLGQIVTFTIEVCNVGQLAGTNVAIGESFATGLTAVGSSTLTFPSIPVGQCQTATLKAQVDNTAPVNLALTSCAAVVGTGSNCGSLETAANCTEVVVAATNIELAKEVQPGTFEPGDVATYVVEVRNLGPVTAVHIVVADKLPPGAAYSSHNLSGGIASYDPVTGKLFIFTLPVGATVRLEVEAVLTRCGILENLAVLTSLDQTDLDTSDNVAGASLLVSGAGCQACAKPPGGMIAWWPLDEATSTVAHDIAGLNHGTHVHGPTPITGRVAGGLRFDGIDDYVEVPFNGNLAAPASQGNGTGDLSIDAWIRATSPEGPILDYRQATPQTANGYSLFLLNGELFLQLADGNGPALCAAAPGPTASCTNYGSGVSVAAGSWHHVAVTVDRDAVDGGRWYLDGAEVGTRFNPTFHPGILGTRTPLYLGRHASAAPLVYGGDLDEVEIFHRALSPAEVHAIYAAGSSGKCHDLCRSTWEALCTSPGTAKAEVTLCNFSLTDQDYSWSASGVSAIPNSVCSVDGPTQFTPPAGNLFVPAGQCATTQVTMQCVSGLPLEAHGCFEISAVNLGSGSVFACGGSTLVTRKWHWFTDVFVYEIPFGSSLDVAFKVTLVSDQPEELDYELQVRPSDMLPAPPIVSLDGRPPGTGVSGSVALSPGQTTEVAVNVAFEGHRPLDSYDLLVVADLDGDGVPVAIASAGLRSVTADCNGNQIDDLTDILQGTPDCNDNGVPDQCDIASGLSRDCNSNGIPDSCDIATGISQNLNGNGKPDECETGTVVWVFSGTAEGGQISVTVEGFTASCMVDIVTLAGQSPATVAANLATAINGDACLAAQGITALAEGGQVTLSGFLIDFRRVTIEITDSGLGHLVPVVTIPTSSTAGLLVEFLLLLAAGTFLILRSRQS